MTKNVKDLLLADSGWWGKIFLTPTILSVKMGLKTCDIDFVLKYNILGYIIINPLQTICELIWNGLSSFHWWDIIHREEHKQFFGIQKSYFNKKDIEYLQKFL